MSNIETIRRTLRLLKDPGELIELRGFLPTGRPGRFHGVLLTTITSLRPMRRPSRGIATSQ